MLAGNATGFRNKPGATSFMRRNEKLDIKSSYFTAMVTVSTLRLSEPIIMSKSPGSRT